MKTAFPDLATLQTLVWRLIVAPEGVRRGAADLHREGTLDSEDLSFLVPPDERLAPEDRLDIYADMYFYRLRDALAQDYPKVASWIGPAHWNNLVTDYLLAHPSRHFSLRELGRALPGFLEVHALGTRFPGIGDLARLEWARVDVFDETDADPITREDLLGEAGGAPADATFALVPSARLLRLDPSALPIWKLLDEDGAVEEGAGTRGTGEPGFALVWRRDFAVFHRSLPSDEARCLRVLAGGGRTLAELGEALFAAQPPGSEPQQVAERLAQLIEQWVRDGLLMRGGLQLG